jgi:hypothetical protein
MRIFLLFAYSLSCLKECIVLRNLHTSLGIQSIIFSKHGRALCPRLMLLSFRIVVRIHLVPEAWNDEPRQELKKETLRCNTQEISNLLPVFVSTVLSGKKSWRKQEELFLIYQSFFWKRTTRLTGTSYSATSVNDSSLFSFFLPLDQNLIGIPGPTLVWSNISLFMLTLTWHESTCSCRETILSVFSVPRSHSCL